MTVASESKILGVSFPDDWLRNKIGRITTKVGSGATPKGGASAYQPTGMPLIRSLNVHNEGFRSYNLAFINDDHARQLEYASVEPGDVLLNITGASILRSAVVPAEVGPARVNQHVSIVRPDTDQVLPGYLHAWLISPVMYSYMYSLSVGSTREAITKEQILRFPIVFPTLEEQRSIISYLESKTVAIDGIIGKLQREVELLERYRRELIAHTVTCGLNPDVPMKDSGIDWIGATPRHWSLLRTSALYDLRAEKVSDKDYLPLSITMSGVIPQLETVAKTTDGDNRKLVRAGDFVINSRSDRRGACGISPQDGSCSLINTVLAPKGSIHNPFFSYLFRSSLFSDEFYRWGHGIHNDLWTTNWSDMKSIQVPVPPIEEQKAIARYLDDKMDGIDSSAAGLNAQIEKLGKYRKQVINDAVTGKVRVGGVA